MNDWGLTIIDTSAYADTIPVTCPTLQILLPGFTKAVTFDESSVPPLAPGFMRTFHACDLGVQTSNCGTEYDCLPDGIYVIKYAVSPHDIVYVEYNHLRITKALKKYQSALCNLELEACAPGAEKSAKLEKLLEIKGYLEAAVAQVEYCHKPNKGMELYQYALKLLEKLDCSPCKNC
jgi:hypothetical protein